MTNGQKWFVLICLMLGLAGGTLIAQLQQSGGPGSVVTANAGTNLNTSALALDATLIGGTLKAEPYDGTNVIGTSAHPVKTDPTGTTTQPVSGTVTATLSGSINNTAFGVSAGTANIGFVRILPSACTQSTNFANATAQVATGAGTTVTSTTTCVTSAYANNITNSAVTLRLADKAGTPVIWLGGNADFSIPANSNIKVPIEGVTFTSGITAIAGTATAVNLQINGVQ
jgi:hypothetical protein